ncbi:hypothetical protein AYO45_02355 [Gammaproteobacteria bacterium SCGC AG-212-F23]|nr:hypothetical protein AYO45_02355 [Gammaproteobacteria bacterium SCGC AG-212-F23]
MQNILEFAQHHNLLASALVAILAALLIVEFLKARRRAASLSPAALVQVMNHQNAAIIDIRSQDAFLNGHIIGAISIPLRDISEKNTKLEKFKSQPIVLICANGLDSVRIATSLKTQGFQVNTLNGGMRAWIDAEMPIVKGQ